MSRRRVRRLRAAALLKPAAARVDGPCPMEWPRLVAFALGVYLAGALFALAARWFLVRRSSAAPATPAPVESTPPSEPTAAPAPDVTAVAPAPAPAPAGIAAAPPPVPEDDPWAAAEAALAQAAPAAAAALPSQAADDPWAAAEAALAAANPEPESHTAVDPWAEAEAALAAGGSAPAFELGDRPPREPVVEEDPWAAAEAAVAAKGGVAPPEAAVATERTDDDGLARARRERDEAVALSAALALEVGELAPLTERLGWLARRIRELEARDGPDRGVWLEAARRLFVEQTLLVDEERERERVRSRETRTANAAALCAAVERLRGLDDELEAFARDRARWGTERESLLHRLEETETLVRSERQVADAIRALLATRLGSTFDSGERPGT